MCMNDHESCLTKKQGHWGTLGLWSAVVSWRQQQPPLSHRQHHVFEITISHHVIGNRLRSWRTVFARATCMSLLTSLNNVPSTRNSLMFLQTCCLNGKGLHLNGRKPSLVPSDQRLKVTQSAFHHHLWLRSIASFKKKKYIKSTMRQWGASDLPLH